MEVTDTYEAAYYYLHGAKLLAARQTLIPLSRRKKYLYAYQWIVTMSDIPADAKEAWRSHQASANVRDLAQARKKIKRFVMGERE